MGVLQLKSLTTINRMLMTPVSGEPIWDTDKKLLYTGDGVTPGGVYPIIENRIYGVAWDEILDTYIRTGSAINQSTTTALPDSVATIHSRMKRCLLLDNGTVNYYCHSQNSNFKEDGVTSSVLTGADGQVMVEIPKFWYRYYKILNTHFYEISPVLLSGFSVHPAFIKNGVEVSYRYMSAYEGTIYDVSASRYVNGISQPAFSVTFNVSKTISTSALTSPFNNLVAGDKVTITGTVSNNGTFTVVTSSAQSFTVSEAVVNETAASTVIETQKDLTVTTGDKLSSVSGFLPVGNNTRAEYRILAKNRGTGWRQQDADLVHAIQVLYLIDYASFNSQSKIGAGLTNVSDWGAFNNYSPVAKSGNSNTIGNATGNTGGSTSSATESTKYLSYRGIENFFGHTWKFIDGININNNRAYVCNNDIQFIDDATTNYTDIGINAINSDGYQATLITSGRIFLPASVGASSSTKVTDYYYQNTGWRVGLFGGALNSGAFAGCFFWYLAYSSSYRIRHIVARLCF